MSEKNINHSKHFCTEHGHPSFSSRSFALVDRFLQTQNRQSLKSCDLEQFASNFRIFCFPELDFLDLMFRIAKEGLTLAGKMTN